MTKTLNRCLFYALTMVLLMVICTRADTYTVLLKTGKRIEGTIVKEDEKSIQIKDKDGLILKFKKDSLALDEMQKINSAEQEKPQEKKQEQAAKPNSLAEQAKQAQKKNTGKAKVLTIEDLEKMPEVSIVGSTENPEKAVSEKSVSKTDQEQKSNSMPSADEQYWRDRARKLRGEIEQLKDRSEEAEKTVRKRAADVHTSYQEAIDIQIPIVKRQMNLKPSSKMPNLISKSLEMKRSIAIYP